jgi:hypothetical protein
MRNHLPRPQEAETGKGRLDEPADRRATERFPVNANASCPFLAPVAEELGQVKIKDISMGGIGLVVSRRVEPGTLLAVTLANPARGFQKTVLVRVIHTAPQTGGYLVSGAFSTPLTYQELSTLVL